MTRDFTCIEAYNKKFPFVCTVGVLQGDHLVHFFNIQFTAFGYRNGVVVSVELEIYKLLVSKGAKIRNRYNQVPHLTQDTNGKVTNSQLDTTNKFLSQI